MEKFRWILKHVHLFVLAVLVCGCTPVVEISRWSGSEHRPECVRDAHLAGDVAPCNMDVIAILATPERYCGVRLNVFGFLSETWGELVLYPDKDRAFAQHISSGIRIQDRRATNFLSSAEPAIERFVTVDATMICASSSAKAPDPFLGTLTEVATVWIVDPDLEAGVFRKVLYEDSD